MTDQGERPPGDSPDLPGAPEPPGPGDAGVDDTLVQPPVGGPDGPTGGPDDPTQLQPSVPAPPPPPPPSEPPQPPGVPWWRSGWGIALWIVLAALATAAAFLLFGGDDDPTTSTTTVSTVVASTTTGPGDTSTSSEPTTTVAPTTTAPPTTTTTGAPTTTTIAITTTSAPPEAAFSDGTHLVGTDIEPGVYETGLVDGFDCQWERLAGTGGTFEEIIANGTVDTHAVVEVVEDDVAFATSDCGDWFELEDLPEPLIEMPPGTWAVGPHVAPGRYEAPGEDSCYWARLSAFTGELEDIIDQDTVDGSVILDIDGGDVGFTSTGCGTWTSSG